jgi:hypothetical protein
MSSQVIVAFTRSSEYAFSVSDQEIAEFDRAAAHLWLDKQLSILECEPSNPLGKTLLLDKLLNVAKYGGEKRFAAAGDWAHRYAGAVARLLDRPVIRVDVGEFVVG